MNGKKDILSMLRLGFILALYAVAACVMLAFVYAGTKNIIAQRQRADLEKALKELFPEADRFNDITGRVASADASVSFESEYEALKKNGDLAGIALRASRGSYGGPIKLLAGISVDGKINGVKILEHQDTPGLGANAASSSYFVNREKKITFYGQFAGKSLSDPFEVKNDIAAVTASTITSAAIAAAVKAAGGAAAAYFTAYSNGGGQ